MNKEELYYFELLKKEVETTFLLNNNAPNAIKDWKGKDIISFQEELFDTVKAKVSEKWFYTYFKKTPENLPRIDILNFLSEYVGYEDWNDFSIVDKKTTKKNYTEFILKIFSVIFAITMVFLWITLNTSKNKFQFCFYDDDKGEPIQSYLNIKIITKKQSPIFVKTDSLGCFTYETKDKNIRFVVQSPFYKTDTIYRNIHENSHKTIRLKTDDYTLMLQYFANHNTKDWQKRKNQLNNLIADDAQIYQLFKQSITIELFSKNEFIDKLTTPTKSLKNLEVLDKTFVNGKIVKLKFRIK